jgi:iron complex outermembrane recepter protein
VDFRVRNMEATGMRGLDLSVEQTVKTRYGRFDAALNSAYVLGFDQALSPQSAAIRIEDTVGNPLQLRARGTLNWHQRDSGIAGFNANLALMHAGAYDDFYSWPRRRVGSLTTLDVWIGYRTAPLGYFGETEIGVGVANAFDAEPPFVNVAIGYDVVNADPVGRVMTVGVSKTW